MTGIGIQEALSLFAIMAILALVPSVSVLTVSSRSASLGLRHGVAATLGIVAGDILYILIAIYGLSLLADTLGEQTQLLRYLGGAYLLWLGLMLWRARMGEAPDTGRGDTLAASFLAGLMVTLADQKAVLFYLGLFPAFLDLSTVSPADTGLVILIATVAVGGAKMLYAALSDRAGRRMGRDRLSEMIHRVAGAVMMGVGLWLLLG